MNTESTCVWSITDQVLVDKGSSLLQLFYYENFKNQTISWRANKPAIKVFYYTELDL